MLASTMRRFAVCVAAFSITASASCAAAPVQAGQSPVPPPPQRALEFFGPTYTDHSSDAICGATKVGLRWRFSPSGLAVTSIVFNGRRSAAVELSKINGWLSKLTGDALVRIECGAEGASFAFLDANLAGTASPKQIQIDLIGGRAILVSERGFR